MTTPIMTGTPADHRPLTTLLTHEEADFIDAFEATARTVLATVGTLPDTGEPLEPLSTESASTRLPHRSRDEVELASEVMTLMFIGASRRFDVAGAIVELLRLNAPQS